MHLINSSFYPFLMCRPPSAPCAECTIQLRLPTGLSVTGGFASTDPVSAVLSFACCFFRSDKCDSVMLRQAHNAKECKCKIHIISNCNFIFNNLFSIAHLKLVFRSENDFTML